MSCLAYIIVIGYLSRRLKPPLSKMKPCKLHDIHVGKVQVASFPGSLRRSSDDWSQIAAIVNCYVHGQNACTQRRGYTRLMAKGDCGEWREEPGVGLRLIRGL